MGSPIARSSLRTSEVSGQLTIRTKVVIVAIGNRTHKRSLSESVRGPVPKSALGPPHDAYAAVGLTLAGAAVLFFVGRARVESDAVGWTGMIASLIVVIALVHYLQRAYGLSSSEWGRVPAGAALAAMVGFMLAMQVLPVALYEQYFYESLFGYSLVCLALAMFSVGLFRAALGPAEGGQA